MKTGFKSKLELVRYYSDEENCKKLLEERRWGDKVTCIHCGHEKVYRTNRGFKCASSKCYKKFSVISGTILENTKIPLNKWFEAIFVLSAHKKGISSHQLAKDIDVSQKCAWFILHRVREMLKDKSSTMLGGLVEADETYVGGKVSNMTSKKRQAHANKFSRDAKTPVVGMLQRDGMIINHVVNKVDRKTIGEMINKNIQQGSVLITDSASSYAPLAVAYQHEVVNHAAGEYFREGWHTNSIEGYWSLLKRGVFGIYHQVSPAHLGRYCDEFAYRYNTRKATDVERFENVLAKCAGRLTWKTLTKK